MLESLWYMLLLVMQILQADPSVRPDRLQFEIYAASAPALTLTVRGTMVQGEFIDSDSRQVLGEFESTRRVPQAFVVFPRMGLGEKLESAMSSADGPEGGGPASTGDVAVSDTSMNASEELRPFTLDFTKAIKLLTSFVSKPRQRIMYTEAERLFGGVETGSSRTQAPSPAPSTGTMTAASPSPSPGAESDSMIEIRYSSNRIVLSADFLQLVIIVTFR